MEKKLTFLGHERPLLVDMVIVETPTQAVNNIRNAIYDGAEAFGMQMERLRPEFRTEDILKKLTAYMGNKPLYITNYRGAYNKEMTEEARMDELMLAIKCGATLVDLTGDTFDPTPGEMTKNKIAIDKQKAQIEKFHEAGAEVLMSSHIFKYMEPEQVLELALEQQSRGVDIAKFVTGTDNEEQLWNNLNTIKLLKKELKIPFLFLSNGPWCKMHRVLGPYFGVCMWLCVQQYDALSSRDQPLLRSMKAIVDNFDCVPNISFNLEN